MDLERYKIAEEGVFTLSKKENNLNDLSNRRVLFVFSTNPKIPYGGINGSKYLILSGARYIVDIDYDTAEISVPNDQKTSDDISTVMDDVYDTIMSYINRGYLTTDSKAKKFLSELTECAKYHNILILFKTSDTQLYARSVIRSYPMVIADPGMLRAYMVAIGDAARLITDRYRDFKRFNTNIPKSMFVNRRGDITLYHVSENSRLKELEPRIMTKPLREENLGVPRICVAPTVDQCFRALEIYLDRFPGMKIKTYYVYKPIITSTTRIVAPDARLVPDVEITGEHWILNPVRVEKVGSIRVIFKNNDPPEFDVSDMPFDPHLEVPQDIRRVR